MHRKSTIPEGFGLIPKLQIQRRSWKDFLQQSYSYKALGVISRNTRFYTGKYVVLPEENRFWGKFVTLKKGLNN